MRNVMRDRLSSQGYLVETAADLGTAVDRIREAAPDLLIIRPYINSMPSHEAVKYLRTKVRGLKVLMVGGLMDDPRITYNQELENITMFPKPFTAEQLFEAVKTALA